MLSLPLCQGDVVVVMLVRWLPDMVATTRLFVPVLSLNVTVVPAIEVGPSSIAASSCNICFTVRPEPSDSTCLARTTPPTSSVPVVAPTGTPSRTLAADGRFTLLPDGIADDSGELAELKVVPLNVDLQ